MYVICGRDYEWHVKEGVYLVEGAHMPRASG